MLNILKKRSNKTTLSVYVYTITAKCFDDETETIERHTFELYNEKVPSNNAIKSDFEQAGLTVVGKLEIALDEEKSGLYEMNHETFVEHGIKVGPVRPKKEKEQE